MSSEEGWAELWLSRVGIVLFAAGMFVICLNLARDLELWGVQSQAQQLADQIAGMVNRVIKYGGSGEYRLRGALLRVYPDGLELIQGNRNYFSDFISRVHLMDPSEFQQIWNECSSSNLPDECLSTKLESKSHQQLMLRARIQAISIPIQLPRRVVLVFGE